jgi:DNA-binding transcriptional LysR family regulator
MKKNMTLDQLRVFVEVAERGHLTQAANVLALTPSAVSAAIRMLEDRYGTQLFDRVGRGIELNANGRIFLIEARAVLAQARAAELTLSELGGEMRGSLSIQASQTIASYWLPPLLTQFRQKYPSIDIQLGIGNSEQVARSVLNGLVDIGFVEGGIEDSSIDIKKIAEDKIVAVVAPNHPWAKKRRIEPRDLLSSRWVLREPGSGTRAAFMGMLNVNGINSKALDIGITLPSNEAVRSAVLAGPYASVLSEMVVRPYLNTGLLSKVNITFPQRAFFLLRHKERFKTKASIALEQIIASS